jgi:Tfp pilus assembly protein PilF
MLFLLLRLCLATTAATYLEEATKFLHNGLIPEALQKFDLAIENDSTNYVAFFKRATAYTISGMNDRAISDLDTVLKLKSDNYQV